MTNNWGIRISKTGHDVKTEADNFMVFSSKFNTLKVHSRGKGSIYDSTGRTITIPHNLGYVPAFIFHTTPDPYFKKSFNFADSFSISPSNGVVSNIAPPYYYEKKTAITWADSTNIYIKLDDAFGYLYTFTDLQDWNYGQQGQFYYDQIFAVGKKSDGYISNGAIRFNNVNESGSVYKAELGIHIVEAYSQTVPVKTYGIYETDTSDYVGNPFGRTKTTNYIINSKDGGLGAGATWRFDVTSIFNEILGISGWSSGNHMGFLCFDNGSTITNLFDSVSYLDGDGTVYNYSLTNLRWLKTDHLADYKYTIFKNPIA